MAFMPWSNEFVIGIQTIDEQHHWLVDLTNQLYDELNTPTPDREKIGEIMEGLVDYTFNHFIVEEEMFQRYQYPETPAHKAEHDRFTKQAAELLGLHENGGTVSTQTLEFLKNWLKHHILEVDKEYVPFFKGKGIH